MGDFFRFFLFHFHLQSHFSFIFPRFSPQFSPFPTQIPDFIYYRSVSTSNSHYEYCQSQISPSTSYSFNTNFPFIHLEKFLMKKWKKEETKLGWSLDQKISKKNSFYIFLCSTLFTFSLCTLFYNRDEVIQRSLVFDMGWHFNKLSAAFNGNWKIYFFLFPFLNFSAFSFYHFFSSFLDYLK